MLIFHSIFVAVKSSKSFDELNPTFLSWEVIEPDEARKLDVFDRTGTEQEQIL